MAIQQMLLGVGAKKKTYVDDIFDNTVYTGVSGSGVQFTNGIDMAGEKGMVWVKSRTDAKSWYVFDNVANTAQGANPTHGLYLNTDTVTAINNTAYQVTMNSNGVTSPTTDDNDLGGNGKDYYMPMFRQAPGFFTICTWTGNATLRTISHSLGSIPGLMIIKRLDTSGEWIVYHKSLGATKFLRLEATDAAGTSDNYFDDTEPTASVFTIKQNSHVNANNGEYVAYLFGDDEQSFGENENASVIKCGSYTGNGASAGPEINLGWEPQWILLKNTNLSTEQWFIFDSMRGIVTGGNDSPLEASRNVAEHDASWNLIDLTSTGFKITNSDDKVNVNNGTYVYVAIRRSDGYVGKPIEDATKCFAMDTGSSSSPGPEYDSGFPVDFAIHRTIASTNDWWTSARLIQGKHLETNNTGAESTSDAADYVFDYNDGWYKNGYGSGVQSWMWKRHAGFDLVTWTGNGVSGRALPHSLNKIPEMIWAKRRDDTSDWAVYHKGLNGGSSPEDYWLKLNTNSAEGNYAIWADTAPTSTHFSVQDYGAINGNGNTHIAMLFASVDGISKVGYYDGSASEQTITTGFQPRFVIIKRVNVTGNWVVMDTTRTWGSGNDDYLFLDTNAAQLDAEMSAPTSTGFTVSTHGFVSGSGNKFIYYAHA